MTKSPHLFLVDGSGYIFRAYHALPPLTRKSDGMPVGAVAGFCNMLWKLLCDARHTAVGITPSHFAVIFDYSAKTFRKEIYPEYKANRLAPPDDLVPQFALIRKATTAFNLPCIEIEGYEADDIIATYAKEARRAGMGTTIISSDKDLMQLVNPDVAIYDSMKDKHIGRAEVIEKWGVGPEKMIELQALTGDSTDNVPGVPGIGPKTAALLLNEFGSLDSLLENLNQIKQPKRRENIQANIEQIRISQRLVKLKDDVPVTHALDDLILEPQNGPKLIAFLKALEFNVLTRRVAEATNSDAHAIEPAQISDVNYTPPHGPDLITNVLSVSHKDLALSTDLKEKKPVMTPEQFFLRRQREAIADKMPSDGYVSINEVTMLASWLEEGRHQGYLTFSIETTTKDPLNCEIIGIALALAPGRAAYIPINHRQGGSDLLGAGRAPHQLPIDDVINLLRPVFEDPAILKISHDIKYFYVILLAQFGIKTVAFDDVMLLSYVLEAGVSAHDLAALADRWLNHKMMNLKELTAKERVNRTFDELSVSEALPYAAGRTDIIMRLWRVLKPGVIAARLARVYETLERPLIPVLALMQYLGVKVDKQILARLSGEFALAANQLEEQIFVLTGEKFNIGSPKQLAEILFGKLGFSGGTKTKTGQWSTSAQVLEDLALAGNEIARKIVDWRQLTRLKSTYTDALPAYLDQDNRVHTNYAMATTTTGRLSSIEPNLQNIPIRTAEGRKIRAAFIAKPGYVLVSADYSQIELRVLAHVADISQLKRAFAQGLDIHALTASEMFNVPVDGMPAEIRRRAKAINFGIIYGISAFGLANQLAIPREEAALYIKTYFERFPGIRDYIEETKQFARLHGFVETIFGRRAHYPDIKSSNPQIRAFNERAAINARIQGSAADIIRSAMVKMGDALAAHQLKANMLLQVHDELVFEVAENEVAKTIKVVKDIMENAAMPAVALAVPLEVEARAAANWEEAH